MGQSEIVVAIVAAGFGYLVGYAHAASYVSKRLVKFAAEAKESSERAMGELAEHCKQLIRSNGGTLTYSLERVSSKPTAE